MENVPTIFVGVDYGTTGSAFSYVRLSDGKTSMQSPRKFPSWPGLSERRFPKTPSLIAYPFENGDLDRCAWGYQVKPGMKSFAWTKLLMESSLDQEAFRDSLLEEAIQIGIMRTLNTIETHQVVSDYLRELYQFICATLRNELGADTLDQHYLEFRFGIPAVWKQKTTNEFFDVIRNAGFGTLVGPDKREPSFKLIQEPEAIMTMLLTSNKYSLGQTIPLQERDGVVICDLGGGTVDLTSYEVVSMSPEISYNQLTKHSGSLCGATAVDRHFYVHLQTLFEGSFSEVPLSQKGQGSEFANDFEEAKCALGSYEDQDTYLLHIGPGFDHADPRLFDRQAMAVKLSREALCGYFEPVTRNICRLLHEEVEKARGATSRFVINKIVLCGGFSQSHYVSRSIQSFFHQYGIAVKSLPNPLMAIADGCACRGIVASPAGRVCPRHYGISYPVPYNYDLDNEANSFVNPLTGHKMARGVIDWFFRKGEVYTDGYTVTKPIHLPFTSGELMAASISIYSCDSSNAPRHTAAPDAQNVSTVFFDFSQLHFPLLGPKMVGGQVHYDLQIIVRFRFDGCNGRGVFEVTAQGRSLSTLELDLN